MIRASGIKRALHLGGEDAGQLQIMIRASGIKGALHLGGEDPTNYKL
jgi:hypothetical protein